MGTGSREENASKQEAFSSEVGTGSREENASKQKARSPVPIPIGTEKASGTAEDPGRRERYTTDSPTQSPAFATTAE
jgi:hypothetical protein